jgi:hypothetical protein
MGASTNYAIESKGIDQNPGVTMYVEANLRGQLQMFGEL